jgi:hypothetical protein
MPRLRFTSAIVALAIALLNVQLAAASGGECICTPRANVSANGGRHEWFVTADGSGLLTAHVVTPVVTNSAQSVRARIFDENDALVGEVTSSYPANSDSSATFRESTTVSVAPGAAYRVEVTAVVATMSARYWLRFDGVTETSIEGGFSNVEGGRTTWLVKVDPSDELVMRIFTEGIDVDDAAPGLYPVTYQWVAPDGQEKPVQTLEVLQPGAPGFIDAIIPSPSPLVTGTWKLRFQTLPIPGDGFDYRLEKLTGSDRRLYLDPHSAGRGGGRVNFVDAEGNPFTDTVHLTLNFGEPATFPVSGGVFETTIGDAFRYPLQVTPPAGFFATPSSFDFAILCDDLTEVTIVIALPQPPAVTVTLSPAVLWPPNNTMRTVTATIGVSNEAGHTMTVELVSIVTSEPGSDDIADASLGTDDRTFSLRAKRSGNGSGRTYTVTYRVTDTVTGLSTIATATVIVPHDQGR